MQQEMGSQVGGLSVRVREAFSDDVSFPCLVREELEDVLMTRYTDRILRG